MPHREMATDYQCMGIRVGLKISAPTCLLWMVI
jgi:hypothetical protein